MLKPDKITCPKCGIENIFKHSSELFDARCGECDLSFSGDMTIEVTFGSGEDARVETFNVYEKGKLETMVLEYYWGDDNRWSREKISIRLVVAGVKYI